MSAVSASETGWRTWAARASGWLLGGVLLLAAVAKVYEPGAFVGQIRLEGLDFLLPAVLVALLALALETGLGLALLLGVHHRLVLASAALLSLFFLGLTGRNYWLVSQGLRDPDESCGCFGSLIERTPAEAFWQDLLLLVPPLRVLLWLRWGKRLPLGRWRIGIAAAAALLVMVGTALSPALHFSEAAEAIASSEFDRAFRVSESFQLEVDGRLDADGRVLESEGEAGVLVLSPALPGPALVDPREGLVRLLRQQQVLSAEDGSVLADAPDAEGDALEFAIVQGAIQFELGGRTFRLVSK